VTTAKEEGAPTADEAAARSSAAEDQGTVCGPSGCGTLDPGFLRRQRVLGTAIRRALSASYRVKRDGSS
jgi:hypothetical protein